MKKAVVTTLLCCLFVVFLFAQAKKPTLTQLSIKRGQQVYLKTCVVCHQRDGGGVPRLNPPLIQTEYVLGDKTRLINIVLKGLNQPLEIEDETYTNVMPSVALTDQQVADVLTYVRNSFGNKATTVTLSQVKAVRAAVK